jgi:hypothetical protein
LGDAETTAAAEAQRQGGSIKSMELANYRVQEIQLPSGTVVREFSTLAGTVFAVAWRGPAIPDLKQILGAYYGAFTAASGTSRGGRHRLVIRQNDFVMQSSGHMRAFTGRAYLPRAVPPGVTEDELH